MTSLTRIGTRNMSREEWLTERRKSIGGSDAAGVIGLSKWSTPYTVWADKTGRLPDKEDTEAMRVGRDLEDYVARRWCEATGKKCHKVNAILRNGDYPFAHADVDRWVSGEDAGLECKTTSTLDLGQFHGIEFPEQYYCQCVHYMAVTGAVRWYLAVLVMGRGFFTYVLERNQAEIDALMAAENTFWDFVRNDTPPAPDGVAVTGEAISTIYAENSEQADQVDLFGREGLLTEYMDLKSQKDAIDERMEQIKNIVKLDIGDASGGRCDGFTVSWKSQERKTFQIKDFAKAYPKIDLAPFYKVTSTRPMNINKIKEDK